MNKKFSIAFFGSSLVSAYWNGAATYYRGIIRALDQLGHRTTFFEPDAFSRQQHRDIADPPWAEVVVYPNSLEGLQESLQRASGADIIVKASGVGVFDSELESEIALLKRPNNLTVFWDVDAPVTLDRMLSNIEDPFRSLVPQYDLVLTFGGGTPVIEAYKGLGANSCHPIYNAFDPDTHYPVEPVEAFASDLTFIGNRLPDREKRVEEFFSGAAILSPEDRFLIGGSGWEEKQFPENVRYIGHVFTKDHNALNCSARAVLNVNRESMASYGFSPATRVFEAAGAGACLITDHWEGVEQFLEPGREILVAKNGAEVAAIIKDLDRERAKRIGDAARRRVLADHTYKQRALQIEEILNTAYSDL